MEEALTLGNYADAIKRRLPLGLIICLALVALTIALALGLPSWYKSRAVILIEAQEIPQDLVRSLVTSYADQRIQIISQRVLTNSNLTGIIEKYSLYTDERESDTLEVVLAAMREDIMVAPISADIVDPKSGKPTQATIAFELAYENRSPDLAQRVANELVTLFLNENLKQRAETSEETLTFLTNESEKLRDQVAELESKLADFKERNTGRLPELMSLNLDLMNRTEQEIAQLENQIRSLEQQRVYLESELAQQEPTTLLYSETGERILGPADRLKVLESEFIPIAARYGDNHPDVVAKRKEIESLRAQVGGGNSGSELTLKLRQLQTELAASEQKYSADHPDIKRLQREIDSLRVELTRSNTIAATIPVSASPERPDNPAYIQLQARLEASNTDLRSLQNQRAQLKLKLAELESRLTAAPQVEREYKMLTRDYETALAKYQEVLAKRQEADLAKTLESNQKGERFTLIEPPVTPEEPDKPNRLAIGFLGLVLSVAGGVGTGAIAESVDSRIYGRTGVARLLGTPPLAVIPNIETKDSVRKRVRTRLLLVSMLLLVLILAALAIHILFRPLDVLFYQVLRVLGI